MSAMNAARAGKRGSICIGNNVSATMCALLPEPVRTMSASLARANERVHLHNERNFPQPKLDSEINVRFLLNKYGNLYCLLLNNSLHVIFFNLKIFQKNYRKENRYR